MEDVTVQKIAELSLDYDISPEKFSVHYKETARENREIILIRIDKANAEDINKLNIVEYYGQNYLKDENNNFVLDADGKKVKNKNIKDNIIISKGDYDQDGFVTEYEHQIVNAVFGRSFFRVWEL